jgi:hypothetical protein
MSFDSCKKLLTVTRKSGASLGESQAHLDDYNTKESMLSLHPKNHKDEADIQAALKTLTALKDSLEGEASEQARGAMKGRRRRLLKMLKAACDHRTFQSEVRQLAVAAKREASAPALAPPQTISLSPGAYTVTAAGSILWTVATAWKHVCVKTGAVVDANAADLTPLADDAELDELDDLDSDDDSDSDDASKGDARDDGVAPEEPAISKPAQAKAKHQFKLSAALGGLLERGLACLAAVTKKRNAADVLLAYGLAVPKYVVFPTAAYKKDRKGSAEKAYARRSELKDLRGGPLPTLTSHAHVLRDLSFPDDVKKVGRVTPASTWRLSTERVSAFAGARRGRHGGSTSLQREDFPRS